ncbi:MAG: hypothetical protein ACE5Q6_08495, partial [Dehalococcoidia bacterium]
MTISSRHRLLLSLAVTALLVALLLAVGRGIFSIGRAQTVAPDFTIETDQETLLVGEPLVLTLKATNSTQSPMDLAYSPFTEFAPHEIFVGPVGQEKAFYVHPSIFNLLFIDLEYPARSLASGESLEATTYVSYDASTNGFAFPTAGRYEVEVLLYYGNAEEDIFARSNTLEVTVQDPAAGVGRTALDFIRAQELGPYLTPQAVFIEEVFDAVQDLHSLRTGFGGTPYSRHAAAALDSERLDLGTRCTS